MIISIVLYAYILSICKFSLVSVGIIYQFSSSYYSLKLYASVLP